MSTPTNRFAKSAPTSRAVSNSAAMFEPLENRRMMSVSGPDAGLAFTPPFPSVRTAESFVSVTRPVADGFAFGVERE